MAVIQKYIQLDDLYSVTSNKIILNNMQLSSDNIKEHIYTAYDSEISMIPSCECGYYKNGYLQGKICPKCDTEVVATFDNVQPMLWVHKFADDLKFINPKFWADLSGVISTKMDGLRWLSDTSYNPPTIPPVLLGLKAIIGGRSYKNVSDNIERIIVFLLHNGYFKTMSKQTKLIALLELYKTDKDKMFSDNVPLINKKLFVMENTNKGNYSSILLADIIDLALLAVSTANDVATTPKRLETNTAKLISKSAELFGNYVRDLISKKGGVIRKQIYGSRAHFTFRTVVSSLRPKFDYDTIHVPWSILCSTFRPHVYSKLRKRGYNHKEADKILIRGVFTYSKELDDIGKELIKEASGKGICVLANRNPSLMQSSIIMTYITRFKTDVEETSTDISILIAAGMNMDFLKEVQLTQ